MTERETNPGPGSDATGASGNDPDIVTGGDPEVNLEDPKTFEFDERRWNRAHAAVDREGAARRREANAAMRDEAQAAADERTLIRRGAAGDREHAAADRDDLAAERDRAQAEADDGTRGRQGAADGHGDAQLTTFDHGRSHAETDHRTSDRVQAGNDREHAAADRRDDALDRDQAQSQADQRTANRTESARDREHAASDREQTIADRAGADRDYSLRRDDLRRAQLDQLTGAFGREIGWILLEREIDRARHGNGELVLAYIDVDGLKRVNDGQGHAAGDALLSDVASAIQKHLRSYDTLVRIGGDEFICALEACTHAIALSRFEDIRATMRQTQPTETISVGFAELLPGDTLEELIARGDVALYEAKRLR